MEKKTMKALVVYGKDDYRFEPEYPIPECGPDDILLKTEGCGVCASDVKCWHGAESYWGNTGATGKRRPGCARPSSPAMNFWAWSAKSGPM